MKAVQAIQGRLSAWGRSAVEPIRLTLSEGERQALRQMITTLLQATAAQAASEERTRQLNDLAGVRVLIERAGCQTQRCEVQSKGEKT